MRPARSNTGLSSFQKGTSVFRKKTPWNEGGAQKLVKHLEAENRQLALEVEELKQDIQNLLGLQIVETTAALEHNPDSVIANTHKSGQCKGQACTIHNRSDHSMRSYPQLWRSDRGIMERVCPHGVGHPDPDDIKSKDYYEWVHGCDGCCAGAYPFIPSPYDQDANTVKYTRFERNPLEELVEKIRKQHTPMTIIKTTRTAHDDYEYEWEICDICSVHEDKDVNYPCDILKTLDKTINITTGGSND